MSEEQEVLKDYAEVRPVDLELDDKDEYLYRPLVILGMQEKNTGSREWCVFTADDGKKVRTFSAGGVLYERLAEVKQNLPFRAQIAKVASKVEGHKPYYVLRGVDE